MRAIEAVGLLKEQANHNDGESVIPILDNQGLNCGCLSVVAVSCLSNESLMLELRDWYESSCNYFLSRVYPTIQNVQRLVQLSYIDDETSILFYIHTKSGRRVGHIGLTRINSRSAELCFMVRGRSGGNPNLIEYAERALLQFCFESLELQNVYLTVIDTNHDVIDIHKRLGFRVISQQSLQMISTNGIVNHVFVAREKANVEYGCSVMSLKPADLNIGTKN